MIDKIIKRIRAGFSGFCIITAEEARAEADLKAAADALGYQLHFWTVTAGLVCPATETVQSMPDPLDAVTAFSDLQAESMLVLKDLQHYLGQDGHPPDPVLVRALRDQLREARQSGKVLIITGCAIDLPADLQKEFTVIELDLPDRDTLRGMAARLAESAGITVSEADLDAAAEAARGLTTVEAEDILALAIVETRCLNAAMIAREKAHAIGRNGILEVIEPTETVGDIGGLDNLKGWLGKRRNAFSREAQAFGLPCPRGILILGIPGTGKSLTAKAAASILQRPILRLDAGKLFAGIVGESEANLRRAVQTAEAIAPCILWIDEIEKGMSGSRSSASTDGGTSARVFGSFLSWMQEKSSPVFVVATANDVSQLPPELLRKGRFDELFFVDLPDEKERDAIWRIHVSRRNRNPEKLDVRAFVKLSEGFTGSEIEQAVIDAMFDCFDNGCDLETKAVMTAVTNTVPLSITMSEQIKGLRKWAAHRARPAGAATKSEQADNTRRRIAA